MDGNKSVKRTKHRRDLAHALTLRAKFRIEHVGGGEHALDQRTIPPDKAIAIRMPWINSGQREVGWEGAAFISG